MLGEALLCQVLPVKGKNVVGKFERIEAQEIERKSRPETAYKPGRTPARQLRRTDEVVLRMTRRNSEVMGIVAGS